MSLAMLRTAGAILDLIGVPGGVGAEHEEESVKNSFDDKLRSKYLDEIKQNKPLEPCNIELRKNTILTLTKLQYV
jgi:hypothetical protein